MNLLLQRYCYWCLILCSCYYQKVFCDDPAIGTLLSSLEAAAGVYKDPSRQAGLERTVLVTGCNHGFLNHLHNFKCFCDRIGLKFLVIALDEKAYQYLSKHTDVYAFHMSVGSDNTSAPIATGSADFPERIIRVDHLSVLEFKETLKTRIIIQNSNFQFNLH